MMRFTSLFAVSIFLAAAAGAQAPADPPTWRIAADGGIAGSVFTTMATLSAERSVGRVAAGARLGAVGGTSYLSPGFEETRFGEAFASVTRRGRVVGLRASAGVGVADIDYFSGGEFFCDELMPPDPACFERESNGSVDGVRGYALATVGLDVYVTRAVGVGAEIRVAGMPGPANASSVGLGLRVRVP